MEKVVHILHCIDAEGPLYESLEATFERLHEIFGIKMDPTRENLEKLQNGRIDFGEKTDVIADVFSNHNLNCSDTWGKIDKMLLRIMSPDFRNKVSDSFGRGWVYNWHCLDLLGYLHNPRRRQIGIHKIFDHYKQMVDKSRSYQDGIHWHFHPMSTYREAHRCATSYVNSPHLYEILCRRIIERNWFPAVFRAGFHTERPDSHWFLEQWIPFDVSNAAYNTKMDVHSYQSDMSGGRFGDWRLAPDDWSIYHPSHDNYQIPGNCRRWISRVLNIKVRGRELSQAEVEKAFCEAAKGKPTILGIASHDFRDVASEVDFVREKIIKAQEKYPQVKFKFCEATEGFRSAIYGPDTLQAVELDVSLNGNDKEAVLRIATVKGEVFGPQPFLAVKTKSGRFIHDNFDFGMSLREWSYVFDNNSIRANDVDIIGVAANDKYGHTFIKIIKPRFA